MVQINPKPQQGKIAQTEKVTWWVHNCGIVLWKSWVSAFDSLWWGENCMVCYDW